MVVHVLCSIEELIEKAFEDWGERVEENIKAWLDLCQH